MKLLKTLNVTIPFAEALDSIPDYKKCMKELLFKKCDSVTTQKVVTLNENCSAVVQQNLRTKIKNPGTFIIPCKVGLKDEKALCDSGAGISLMPLSLF